MKEIQMCLCIIFLFAFGIVYELCQEPDCFFCNPISRHFLRPKDVMSQGRNVIFLESTNRLQLSPLVSCSVESAARIYPDRPIIFFMKGLNNNTLPDIKSSYPSLFFLSTMKNVFLLPLQEDILFQDTPLLSWYLQVNTTKEKYWAYIISDAIRLAVMWKYGGIYMDTDVISIKPIPVANFLAAQSSQFSSNGVLGFQHHHWFLWKCMKDFVQNYNGEIWGNQGPYLFTRILKKLCSLRDFENVEDHTCYNISFLHPQRFYPISYEVWTKYYEVWISKPEFNYSYALHLWNFMNQKEKKNVIIGSNTLVENLFRTYCPGTYRFKLNNIQLLQNKTN